jgi:hypothetical protein
VREREEVVELPQLRGRVHGLLATAPTGRPGIGGLVGLGRGGGIGGRGFLRSERSGTGHNVEQPPHVRNGELLCVVLCVTAAIRRRISDCCGGLFYTLAIVKFSISGTYLRRW